MIAVTGATGNVGGRVAERLLQVGERVRALGRSAERLEPLRGRGAEVTMGNLMDRDAVRALFRDVEAALVVLPDNMTDAQYVAHRSTMSHAITEALREQRVTHVVFASSIGAGRDEPLGPVSGLHELEALLFGLESASVLSIRAGWHMENLLGALPMIQAQRINGSAIKGDLPFPMVATADIAERAAKRLIDRDFSGAGVETVLGPEDVTMQEATRLLGARIGVPDLPYVEFPAEGVIGALVGAGMSAEFAAQLAEMQLAISNGRLQNGTVRSAETASPTHLQDFLQVALPQ
jgi:uncharacterized protein YbjT (DUF2867 family)